MEVSWEDQHQQPKDIMDDMKDAHQPNRRTGDATNATATKDSSSGSGRGRGGSRVWLSLWLSLSLSFASVGAALLFLQNGALFENIVLDDSIAIAPDQTGGSKPTSPNASDEGYLQWLQNARNESLQHTDDQPLLVYYRAMSGLGHQLLRLSGVYHLAAMYQLPFLWLTENPVCGGDIFTVYDRLIGKGQLLVDVPYLGSENVFRRSDLTVPREWPNLTLVDETQLIDEARSSLKRSLSVPNTVPGYMQIFAQKGRDRKKIYDNHYWRKDLSDYQLYHQLMTLFGQQHRHLIREVMTYTNFTKHTVFGLHIRAGNGEKGDFQQKHRGIEDIESFVTNIVDLLCSYHEKHRSQYFTSHPMLIFVGTDTESVVTKLQAASEAACHIPFVSAKQSYPATGKGVSFNQKYKIEQNKPNEQCLRGWVDQMLDMYFLTKCNTVIAGTYSSFTQAAPLSYMMQKSQRFRSPVSDRAHPHYFCDIGKTGSRMDCASTLKEWLEAEPSMIWGDVGAMPQARREELQFPVVSRPPTDITRLFKGTAMLP